MLFRSSISWAAQATLKPDAQVFGFNANDQRDYRSMYQVVMNKLDKGIIGSMYQVDTKRFGACNIHHTYYYNILAFSAGEESTAGEPINTQSRSVAVDDLAMAQTSYDPSNNIVFYGRTKRALKDNSTGACCYDKIMIPRWRAVTGVCDVVRVLEQSS